MTVNYKKILHSNILATVDTDTVATNILEKNVGRKKPVLETFSIRSFLSHNLLVLLVLHDHILLLGAFTTVSCYLGV